MGRNWIFKQIAMWKTKIPALQINSEAHFQNGNAIQIFRALTPRHSCRDFHFKRDLAAAAEIIVDWWIFHLNFYHFIMFFFLSRRQRVRKKLKKNENRKLSLNAKHKVNFITWAISRHARWMCAGTSMAMKKSIISSLFFCSVAFLFAPFHQL